MRDVKKEENILRASFFPQLFPTSFTPASTPTPPPNIPSMFSLRLLGQGYGHSSSDCVKYIFHVEQVSPYFLSLL